MTTTKFPTTRSEVANVEIPIGVFAPNSPMARDAHRAILTNVRDATDIETVKRWMNEIASDGGSPTRRAIHMAGRVDLVTTSESDSLGRPGWALVVRNGSDSDGDWYSLARAASTVASFAAIDNLTARANTPAAAALLRSVGGEHRTNEVKTAYGETLEDLGFIDNGPSYEAKVSITFDRSSIPATYDVRDWLRDTLEKADPRPCGSPEDWLGEVVVDEVSTVTSD